MDCQSSLVPAQQRCDRRLGINLRGADAALPERHDEVSGPNTEGACDAGQQHPARASPGFVFDGIPVDAEGYEARGHDGCRRQQTQRQAGLQSEQERRVIHQCPRFQGLGNNSYFVSFKIP